MIELPVYDQTGEEVESIEIDPDMLGGEVNIPLLHQAIVTYQANSRVGTASTKTRSDVDYSNAKPWPQKGLGRARHGERGSPIWVGGGITFGPHPRDFSKKLTKNMKRRAFDSALLSKLQDDEVVVLEKFDVQQPKTKEAVELLDETNTDDTRLVLTSEYRRNAYLATRNLPKTELKPLTEASAEDLLEQKYLIIEEEALTGYVQERVRDLHDVDLEEAGENEQNSSEKDEDSDE